MARLSERPTREQWQVAAWMFIVALAALGSVGLWYGLNAPAEKRDIGRQLMSIGYVAWAAAVCVWCIKRGAEWYLE